MHLSIIDNRLRPTSFRYTNADEALTELGRPYRDPDEGERVIVAGNVITAVPEEDEIVMILTDDELIDLFVFWARRGDDVVLVVTRSDRDPEQFWDILDEEEGVHLTSPERHVRLFENEALAKEWMG